jgi:hypothetical protein
MSVDYAALGARLRIVIQREIDAIDKMLARKKSPEPGSPERERAARSLAALAKLLHGLALIDKVPADDQGPGAETEGQLRDLDEFRRELTRRLAAVRGTGDSG